MKTMIIKRIATGDQGTFGHEWLQRIVTASFSLHPALILLDTIFIFPQSRIDHCA